MYQKILLASDLSDASGPVFQKAIEMANSFSAELHVMSVVEPIVTHLSEWVDTDAVNDNLITAAQKRLKQFVDQFALNADRSHIVCGYDKQAILEFAQEINADLLVMGSRSTHGIKMLGSTTHYVLGHAHCDVLTVPHRPHS